MCRRIRQHPHSDCPQTQDGESTDLIRLPVAVRKCIKCPLHALQVTIAVAPFTPPPFRDWCRCGRGLFRCCPFTRIVSRAFHTRATVSHGSFALSCGDPRVRRLPVDGSRSSHGGLGWMARMGTRRCDTVGVWRSSCLLLAVDFRAKFYDTAQCGTTCVCTTAKVRGA